MDDLFYWVALNSIHGVGPRTARILLEHFGSPRAVLEAKPEEMRGLEGVDAPSLRGLAKGYDPAKIAEQIRKAGEWDAHIVTLDSPDYPRLLREIADPPIVLYIRGEIRPEDEKSIAIVGSRKISNYGRTVTENLSRELAAHGITIVSGFARGIDTTAHQTVLNAGGRTLAVLGCGLDICYPAENRDLMDRIVCSGAAVSEFPMTAPPEAFHFPRRNRIISALSRGVIVVEASEKSGALITVQYALEHSREVFAVPGPITDPNYLGCNRLIQNGAAMVLSARDVIEPLRRYFGSPDRAGPAAPPPDLSSEEKQIYPFLSYDPVHVDLLTAKSGHAAPKLLGILLGLELRGLVRQLSGKNFVKV